MPTFVGFTSIKPLTFLAVLLTQRRVPAGRQKKLTCRVKTREESFHASLAHLGALHLSPPCPLSPFVPSPPRSRRALVSVCAPLCVCDSQLHAPSLSRAASSRPADVLISKLPTAGCNHCWSVSENIQWSAVSNKYFYFGFSITSTPLCLGSSFLLY